MKYSVVIAQQDALPSAFVVFRGFEEFIPVASELGYDGVELAIRSATDIDQDYLHLLLEKYRLQVSAISTGQVFADTGYCFTDPQPESHRYLIKIFKEIIDVASKFGKKVNVGRIRGPIDTKYPDRSKNQFFNTIREICIYAEKYSVDILLEPVNRYELNFINNLSEGVAVLQELKIPNLFLMPDLFHMNIEDPVIEGSLVHYAEFIKYLHFADSNRLSPGSGHLDFSAILKTLHNIEFKEWIGVEILPVPDPFSAAKNAIRYIKKIEKQIIR